MWKKKKPPHRVALIKDGLFNLIFGQKNLKNSSLSQIKSFVRWNSGPSRPRKESDRCGEIHQLFVSKGYVLTHP
jgi:hypothetical protein